MKQSEYLGMDLPEQTDPVDVDVLSESLSMIDRQLSAGGGIPPGCIVIWSGASTAIPVGWALCDGSNGTPDLRDRFVVGAGSSYSVGATGGEKTHKLTIGEMPSHSHSINYYGSGNNAIFPYGGGTVKGTTSSNSAGGGAAHNNMPPYYAMCYIMKL